MRRSSWYALLTVAVAGCAIAGLIALALVAMVGWLGVLIIGLAACLVAVSAELHADSPVPSVTLLRRQYEQTFEGTKEQRFAKWAERVERNRLLYIGRTIGIATALIGLTCSSCINCSAPAGFIRQRRSTRTCDKCHAAVLRCLSATRQVSSPARLTVLRSLPFQFMRKSK